MDVTRKQVLVLIFLKQQIMANIIIDCEKMRNHNSGFYYFCKNLVTEIIAQGDPQQDHLSLYLPKQAWPTFNNYPDVLFHKKWHKHFFPLSNPPDVWHCTTQLSRYLPTSRKAKIVLTIHDINVLYEFPDDKRLIKNTLKAMQQRIDRAEMIVTISDYVKADVLKHLRIGDKPIKTIYNGCNLPPQQRFEPPKSPPPGEFLFALGYVNAKKNFHVLPSLLKGNDYTLVIGGVCDDMPYRQKIIDEARKHGVEQRLILTGGISENDKYWYFSQCAAFLFPSLAEGFGLPPVEAMYFGKPVFLSEKTCLPEIGGDAAYYFQNFEPEHLREVFVDGMAKAQHAASMQAQAARFNWQNAAQHYLQTYHYFS